MRLDESFKNQCFTFSKVLCASSYGHFIARKEFWSQCHILLFCNTFEIIICNCLTKKKELECETSTWSVNLDHFMLEVECSKLFWKLLCSEIRSSSNWFLGVLGGIRRLASGIIQFLLFSTFSQPLPRHTFLTFLSILGTLLEAFGTLWGFIFRFFFWVFIGTIFDVFSERVFQ